MTQKEFRENLKLALKRFDPYRKGSWNNLHDLGFDVEYGGKHYKLHYHGKQVDHTFCIPCTSSDYRATLNICTKIMRGIGNDIRRYSF